MSCIYVDRQYDKCMECVKREFVEIELLPTLMAVFVALFRPERRVYDVHKWTRLK